MATIERNLQQTLAAIQSLDLDPIKFKLMDKKEGQGWTRAQADHYEVQYRRFLTLLAKHPDETIAPGTNVDKFWHGHILDTLKYAEDCQRVFGYFLHHFPYFGMRGEEDANNLSSAAENMKRLYEQEFGSQMEMEGPSFCSRESPSFCSGEAASFCSGEAASFCSTEKAEAASFCSGTSSAKNVLKTHIRPTLSPA